MTAAWMVYAFLVALLLGAAAWAAERSLRLAGRPGRWPWAAALLGSWLLPVAALLRGAPSLPGGTLVVATRAPGDPAASAAEHGRLEGILAAVASLPERAGELIGPLLELVPGAAAAVGAVSPGWAEALPRWGVLLWILSSAAALALVAAAVTSLLRRSRAWPEARVLGERVRLSPDFGPAVLGVVRPHIVLPRWVLRMGQTPVRLILEHEREHRRARDTLLLTLGGLAALAAPWNLPLWWQLRRLRLAVELDCDRRVLRGGAHPREYGALLVEIGARVGRVGLPATALAEQSSFLERRLRMITERRTKGVGWGAAGAAALAVATVVVACETPAPTEVAPPAPTGEIAGTVSERPTVGRYDFQAVEVPSDPLIVVDGVVAEGKGLAHVQALDVERIEVIRTPAAAELYGEQGRNGVVLVTTKKAAGGAESGEAGVYELREKQYDEAYIYGGGDTAGLVRKVERTDGDERPLVFVDGVIREVGLSEVDEQDVESIEVIKGGAARAIYGERGAHGVVRIKTRPVVRATNTHVRTLSERSGESLPGGDPAGAAARAELEAVEVAPVVFVDGELWTRPVTAFTELEIEKVDVLKGAAADRFLEGRGIARDGRTVIRVTTKR